MSKVDVKDSSKASPNEEVKKKTLSKFNAEKLRNLIKQGKNANQIMAEMELVHKQVLKAHVQKLSTIDKVFYEVPGLFDINMRECYVNKNYEIKFNMKVLNLDGMILHPDDEFEVKVDANTNTITLTKKVFNQKKKSEKETEKRPNTDASKATV